MTRSLADRPAYYLTNLPPPSSLHLFTLEISDSRPSPTWSSSTTWPFPSYDFWHDPQLYNLSLSYAALNVAALRLLYALHYTSWTALTLNFALEFTLLWKSGYSVIPINGDWHILKTRPIWITYYRPPLEIVAFLPLYAGVRPTEVYCQHSFLLYLTHFHFPS